MALIDNFIFSENFSLMFRITSAKENFLWLDFCSVVSRDLRIMLKYGTF